MALATGQITIVDLTDLPSLQGYLTTNLSKAQFRSFTGTYSPDWTSAPNNIINAELYVVGSGTNIITDPRVTAIAWYKDGVEITASGGGITLVPSVTGNLKNTSITITSNLLTQAAPTLKISCVISYKHTSTVQATPVKIDIDFNLTQEGALGGTGATGLGALTVLMTNESCTVPADSAGTVSSYTSTTNTIRVFEGSTELTFDSASTANGFWKATAVGTGITAGAVTKSGLTGAVAAASALTASPAKIVYTITGKRANGDAFTATKEQTVTRANAGASAPSISLSATSQMIKYDEKGTLVGPSSVTITSTRQNITGTTYTWTFGLDGASPTTALNPTNFPGVTFGTDTATITAASTGWAAAKSVTIKAVNGSATDTITIVKLQDGAYAYLLSLEATSNTMVFDYLGAPKPAGQTIDFVATNNNIPGTLTFSATSYDSAGTGTAFANLTGTGNTRILSIANWPANAVRMKVTATIGSYTDSVTVIKIQDAANAFSGYLTNESITLACDKSGNVIGSLAALTAGTFKTFLGTTSLSSGVAYAADQAAVGCTGTINSTTGVYSLLTLTGDTATYSVKATHTASNAVLTKVITISKSKVGADGEKSVILTLSAPDGDVFKSVGGVTPAPLKIAADLYEGATVRTSGVTYAWYYQTGVLTDTDAGTGWKVVNTTNLPGTSGNTTRELTVPASAVSSLENFKCKATLNSVSYFATYTLTDMTDPYQVEISCPGGTTFFNGEGTTKTLTAIVRQGGQVVDVGGSTLAYTWKKYVNNSLVGTVGTTKSISVLATDIDTDATYTCDIDIKP